MIAQHAFELEADKMHEVSSSPQIEKLEDWGLDHAILKRMKMTKTLDLDLQLFMVASMESFVFSTA